MKKTATQGSSAPVYRVKMYKHHKLWVAAVIAGTLLAGISFASYTTNTQPVQAASQGIAATATINVKFEFIYNNQEVPGLELNYSEPANTANVHIPTDYNAQIKVAQAEGYTYMSGPGALATSTTDQDLVYKITLGAQVATVNHDAPMNKGDVVNAYYNSTIPNDGVNAAALNKTVTQTIHFISRTSGKTLLPDQTQSIAIYRDGNKINLVTGEVAYGAWTTKDSKSITSPTIAGYYAPQPAVTTLNTANGLTTANVTYYPIPQTASVKFVDDDDNGATVGAAADFSGNIESDPQAYDMTDQIPAGYELAAGQSASGDITYTADTANNTDQHQTIQIHLVHKHAAVEADGPYVGDVTASDLNRTNTETIHYQYADGTTAGPDATRDATATRSAVVDLVTGHVLSYSDWINGRFPAVTSPSIAGYTASEGTIAAVEDVTADAEAIVRYTKNALPNTGNTGSNGSVTNTGSTGTESGSTGSKSNGTTRTGTTSKASAYKLPNTGDTDDTSLIAAGLVTLLSTLGLAGAKRRQH